MKSGRKEAFCAFFCVILLLHVNNPLSGPNLLESVPPKMAVFSLVKSVSKKLPTKVTNTEIDLKQPLKFKVFMKIVEIFSRTLFFETDF